ncbi:hypothetical protein T261_1909 [Streptomyces lydicus]|nr:hypothetical protein T261_1909 [Streptomyces lydicus]
MPSGRRNGRSLGMRGRSRSCGGTLRPATARRPKGVRKRSPHRIADSAYACDYCAWQARHHMWSNRNPRSAAPSKRLPAPHKRPDLPS